MGVHRNQNTMPGARDMCCFFTSGLYGKLNPTALSPYWLIIVPHVHFPNCQGGPPESYGGNDGLLISWLIWGQTLMKGKSIKSTAPNHAFVGFFCYILELTWPRNDRIYIDFFSFFPGLISSDFTRSYGHLPLSPCPWSKYFAILPSHNTNAPFD